ncbi:MAG: tetratricopeptide repeat protein [Dissulfurispiraceae bacterium]
MLKSNFLSAILLFLLALTTSACQQKEQPKPQSQPVGQIQPQNDPKILQDIVQKDPNNLKVWIELGNVLMDTSRFNEAIDAYQKALSLDPTDVDVRVDMGTCYRNVGRSDIALKEFRKAIEINPNHALAHRNMGVVLAADVRDNAQAVKEYEKYLQLAPNAVDADTIREDILRLKAAK